MSVVVVVRHGVVFPATAISVNYVVRRLQARIDGSPGSPAQGVVPAMIAALLEGNHLARRRRKPDPREARRFARDGAEPASFPNLAPARLGSALVPKFARPAAQPSITGHVLALPGLHAGAHPICDRLLPGFGVNHRLSPMGSGGEIG